MAHLFLIQLDDSKMSRTEAQAVLEQSMRMRATMRGERQPPVVSIVEDADLELLRLAVAEEPESVPD